MYFKQTNLIVKKLPLYLFALYMVSFSIGCVSDKPDDGGSGILQPDATQVFIGNEGNFQQGNAQLSVYIPKDSNFIQDVFASTNGRSLGDVLNGGFLQQDKLYLVLNNSGTVEIIDTKDFKSIGTVTGFTSPRNILPVSNNKAYVSDLYANQVEIVDLNTLKIIGNIPCAGWTEDMLMAYGTVFVTNGSRPYLYLIDTKKDQLTDSIYTGTPTVSLKEDKNGQLWVLCGPGTNGELASLQQIDPITLKIEKKYNFVTDSERPWRLTTNQKKDSLYYLNEGVFGMSINDNSLPSTPLIAQDGRYFYSIGIEPKTSIIYVSDAIDFVQRGRVYRYTQTGQLINSFTAGNIPGQFYFK